MKEILELIENVDPGDAVKLDEINAQVWFFLRPEELQYYDSVESYIEGIQKADQGYKKGLLRFHPSYCTSRDALKATRPDKWIWSAFQHRGARDEYVCTLLARHDNHWKDCNSPHLPTEELAELHAIIQAISFERGQP